MVASNNSGGFRPTADVQRALANAGFAFRAPEISWNAPANQPTQARNEIAQREAEERQKAQEAIENNVTNIRSALSNPNIDQATRAKLEADLGKLEGLRTQLDGGRASAAQVSASVASITGSVSAAVAGVSAGGAMGAMSAAQLSAIDRQFGLQSISNARTPEEAQAAMRHNFTRISDHIRRSDDWFNARGYGNLETPDEKAKREEALRRAAQDPSADNQTAAYQEQLRLEQKRLQAAEARGDTEAKNKAQQSIQAIQGQIQQLQPYTTRGQEQRQGTGQEQTQTHGVEQQTHGAARLSTSQADAAVERLQAQTRDVFGRIADNRNYGGTLAQTAMRENNQSTIVNASNTTTQAAEDRQAEAAPTRVTREGSRFARASNVNSTASITADALSPIQVAVNSEPKPAEAAQVAANEQTKEAAREAARPAAQAQVKPDGEASKTEAAKPTQVAGAAPATQSAAAARA